MFEKEKRDSDTPKNFYHTPTPHAARRNYNTSFDQIYFSKKRIYGVGNTYMATGCDIGVVES
jgi:hypothetical protein